MQKFQFYLLGMLWAGVLAGCTTQTGPDSNTGVFKTPEQATAARKAKLLDDWQKMAERIANAERPDIKTSKGEGFTLNLAADGVEQTIDLGPLVEKLTSASGKEREPIRAYLAQKIPPFDRARLAKIGFARAKPMLHPELFNMRQTEAMKAPDTGKPPIANRVVIDLNWVPVVRWPESPGRTAVDADMAAAWNVSIDQVNAAAMDNLKQEFASRNQTPIETTELPGMGRYASLRSGFDPAIILLSDFLAAVRKEWKTTDDLVLFLPSRNSINLLERKNEKLLDRMIPEWNSIYAKVPDPMLGSMILASDSGLSLFSYTSANAKPATAPATKPKPYIVH
jgi:hypothetical protein